MAGDQAGIVGTAGTVGIVGMIHGLIMDSLMFTVHHLGGITSTTTQLLM
jgi:hypothetical protein